ncbi:MAG: hypothetical protein KGK03_01400 [Candidatus Omnitrophica bacterium]|nr:hypothetical protein [Candidatus Omnitrophota bacterium]
MSKRTNKKGQTALILVLLSAAALVFLAITYNWGRVAQIKSLLTISADQSASLLASDAASYGEQEKQTSLGDSNKVSGMSGLLMDVILVVVIIVIIVIEIVSWGSATPLVTTFLGLCLTLALVMAVVTLVLQLTVIQPGMCELWNKLQKSQPIVQQFYEGAVGPALQGAVTDQVRLTDYFDENANGLFGVQTNSGSPTARDTIPRFGFFYTERLKMLNKNVGYIPQAVFFYDQLREFIGGQTCLQNFSDNKNYPGVPLNPSCIDPATGNDYCAESTTDPACTGPIPVQITCAQNVYESNQLQVYLNPSCSSCNNSYTSTSNYSDYASKPACRIMVNNNYSFQLNDSCSDPSNPYCNPCCQPLAQKGSSSGSTVYKPLRPASCYPYNQGLLPTVCATNPTAKDKKTGLPLCSQISGPGGDPINGGFGAPSECYTGNPYGTASPNPYTLIYDPTYQQYANGISFLDQYGRDQQLMQPTATSVPLAGMTVKGEFPNGIYPFFWLMDMNPQTNSADPNAYKAPSNYFSPEVDKIDPTNCNNYLQTSSWYHWCVAQSNSSCTVQGTGNRGVPPVSSPSSTAFPDLNQLRLSYTCQGKDCCVNYLPDSSGTNSSTTPSNTLTINAATNNSSPVTVVITAVSFTAATAGQTDNMGTLQISFTASDNSGSNPIVNVAFFLTPPGSANDNNIASVAYDTSQSKYVFQGQYVNQSGSSLSTPYTPEQTTVTGTVDVKIPTCFSDPSAPPNTYYTLPTGDYSLAAMAQDAGGYSGSTTAPSSVTMTDQNACAYSNANCGEDICGNSCGSCPTGTNESCSTTTTPGTCGCTYSPTPGNCGTTTSLVCCASAADVCHNSTCCTPASSCPTGDNCGSVSDGCGGTINCGSCTSPQTCGGGGTANVCGCTPNCSGVPTGGSNGCNGTCP